MAISLHTAGSWAYDSSGSLTVALPTHSAGDMLIARVAIKSGAIATCTASCATAGWAKVGQKAGTTNSGNGTGSVLVAAFWKIAASGAETNPTIDFTQTNTQGGSCGMAYQKGAGETWNDPLGDGGLDEGTANTSHSATIATHVSVTAGDLVDFFTGIRDDTTMTVPTMTQASVTFDAVVESPAAAGTDTGGDDGAYDGGYRIASSGTSSAAAVVTGTLSTSEQGTSWMTRLRVFTPETHSGSASMTGGGAVTPTGQKAAQSAQTATGGGAVTYAAQKGAQVVVGATGGGASASASTGAHLATAVMTGGGSLVASQSTERSAAVLLSGGGVVTPSGSKAALSTVILTGGGLVTAVGEGGGGPEEHSGTAVVSGGGSVTASVLAARFGAALLSGGGIVTVSGLAQGAPPPWTIAVVRVTGSRARVHFRDD